MSSKAERVHFGKDILLREAHEGALAFENVFPVEPQKPVLTALTTAST